MARITKMILPDGKYAAINADTVHFVREKDGDQNRSVIFFGKEHAIEVALTLDKAVERLISA